MTRDGRHIWLPICGLVGTYALLRSGSPGGSWARWLFASTLACAVVLGVLESRVRHGAVKQAVMRLHWVMMVAAGVVLLILGAAEMRHGSGSQVRARGVTFAVIGVLWILFVGSPLGRPSGSGRNLSATERQHFSADDWRDGGWRRVRWQAPALRWIPSITIHVDGSSRNWERYGFSASEANALICAGIFRPREAAVLRDIGVRTETLTARDPRPSRRDRSIGHALATRQMTLAEAVAIQEQLTSRNQL